MRHVTGVLENVGLVELPPMREEDREFYLMRGKMVHKATELFDLGVLDRASVDPRIEPYLAGWEKFRQQAGGGIVNIEFQITHKQLDYTGTLDRVFVKTALAPGRLLVDIKCGSAPLWAPIQTAAYSLAYRKRFRGKVSRGVVVLPGDGKWIFDPHKNDAADDAAWLAALTMDSWLVRNGKQRKDKRT